MDISKQVAELSGNRAKKLEFLKKKLSENHDLTDLKVVFSMCLFINRIDTYLRAYRFPWIHQFM